MDAMFYSNDCYITVYFYSSQSLDIAMHIPSTVKYLLAISMLKADELLPIICAMQAWEKLICNLSQTYH